MDPQLEQKLDWELEFLLLFLLLLELEFIYSESANDGEFQNVPLFPLNPVFSL